MNEILDEMLSILHAEDSLMHYGMPRRSGRYPWGSGEDPYQHNKDFLSRVEELKKNGWAETPENIKKEFGLTTTQYRIEKSLATNERRMLDVARAKSLAADGKGATEIGREMGINESTVRSLLNAKSEARMMAAQKTADQLKEIIDTKGMIDVGANVNRELGVSSTRFEQALYLLERQGYPIYKGGIPQATNPGQQTNQRVICPPGTLYKEIYNYDKINTIHEYTSRDGGDTLTKLAYPKSLDSSRIKVRYADEVGPDGFKGIDKDGIVEIRRGVADLSLGEDHYAQVRILVDNNKYIKGMAVYSDNIPDGVDLVFNANKTAAACTSKMDVFKDIKKDPDNPFGSLIKAKGQSYYDDPNGEYTDPVTGKKQSLSVINKRASEGDWSEWKDTLPSQFLGKQSKEMAQKQLDLAKADKFAEFEEYCSLTNPTIKKHLLQKFADSCDAAAVDLKAAALPGQKYHVIIPVNTLGDNEVYAPRYEPGTKLALVRYPHGGTFEIPVVTVVHKNKNKLARDIIGNSEDAIGINKNVADRLSGADFDGDTVMCIPTDDAQGKVKIARQPRLKDLEGFDPKLEYPERPGMKYMKDPVTGTDNTQREMGVISNLITDMTLGGAGQEELARAVRHSMVVIDAGKHKLDYKQSELDHNIAALKKDYQVHVDENGRVHYGGAATILSRSKGEYTVDKRQGSPKVNMPYDKNGKPNKDYDPTRPDGALIYKTADDLYYPDRKYDKETGVMTIRTADRKRITYKMSNKEDYDKYNPVKHVDPDTGEVTYTDKSGTIQYRVKTRTQKSTNMAETDDPYTLVSEARHPMELIYADHASYMKNLANQARKEAYTTGKIAYSATAKEAYREEVNSLMSKLNTALLNTTRERAAQRKANAEVKAKQEADPTLKKGDLKKARQQAISKYRQEVGSISRKDRNIEITDREWEAIQAGAISESQLKHILDNTDIDKLRERATPRATNTLSEAKQNKIRRMNNSNYSLAEIAASCGCSVSTVSKYLKE